ncbi:ribosomal RNA-processing protein 8 (RRP8) [Vairimorpha necatrix]|uniref:Ribosomal RNA-processing protein 8 n=1 Tax=Vairimorpha necatrix TaxID=6039 RepID=A0AAX4JDM2_9MICR
MKFQEELENRLLGSKFRLLNDKLYKNKKVSENEMKEYFKYYEYQIKKWPCNPLDLIIKKITEKNKDFFIADLGCGSGKIRKNFKNVFSFDSFPVDSEITKADISKVPLEDKKVDVVVCCLSLMMDYISKVLLEVSRILKIDGIFYLAEVKSRISSVNFLCKQLESFGFKVLSCDTSNSHFVLIELKKVEDFSKKKIPKILLKPCSYKKR